MKQYYFILLTLISTFFMSSCAPKTTNFVDMGNGIIKVTSSPLIWQQGRSTSFTSWEDAKNYVDNLELGGYSDWRLPTADEFLDLYFSFDYGKAKAGKETIVLRGNYWSDDKDGIGFSGAWLDGDSCDISRSYKKCGEGYVRAVRP